MGTRMPKVKCAFVDLSGTLHVEDEAVLGAQDALKRLREQVPIVRFVTNTTKESKRLLHGRLIRLGFDVRPEEMFTSLTMARTVVEKRLRAGGSGRLPLLLVDDQALEDFAGLGAAVEDHGEHNREFDCVVVGLAPDKLNYDRMNLAFRSLRSGASLVAVHKARYYRRKDGLALGPGPFVRALEYASGVKAEVCGKPEKNFFLSALDGTGCSPAEAVMIGDDVRDDVLGAQNAGLVGILVQTGKYVEGDDEKYGRPDFCVRDFVEAVDAICHS